MKRRTLSSDEELDDEEDDFVEEITSGSEYSPEDSDESQSTPVVKRTRRNPGRPPPPKKKAKNVCHYGEKCYRRNPDHFREFSHPHLEKVLADHDGSATFNIPSNLNFQRTIVEQQLNILKNHALCPVGTSKNAVPKAPTSNNQRNVDIFDLTKPSTSALDFSNDGNKNTSKINSKNDTDFTSNGPSTSVTTTKKEPECVKVETDDKRMNNNANIRKIEDFFKVVAPKGKMAEKHKKAAPYYLFFTTITSSKVTHDQPISITFQELLDRSLGNLECSLQINFMVDIGWLLAQYYFAGYSNKPLTILYGDETPDIKDVNKKRPNVKTFLVPMQNPFGKHHTKMSILCYDDGSLRVVISTANLYIDDWENRTQGLWISPRCPRLDDPVDVIGGDSTTGFKRSLINYLNSYTMSCLNEYIDKVKHADFSAVNVFFVASVPGSHFDNQWAMTRVGNLLAKNCVVPENECDNWDLVVQSSSVGSFGADPKLWLCGEFRSNFSNFMKKAPLMAKQPSLKFIYPSLENVRNSHDNLLGGGCLPYSNSIHMKQNWLNKFLYEWSAVHSGRNQAMPHIKSYLRTSPDHSKAAFFLLTSANVSKAAWGVSNKGNKALRVNSYEVGVMFLPKFVIQEDFFSLELSDPRRLPVPYDLPPIPYETSDVPWVMDNLM